MTKRKADDTEDRVMVVTGASSGLGGGNRGKVSARADFFHYAGVPVANPFEGDGLELNKKAGTVRGYALDVLDGREDQQLTQNQVDSLATRGLALIQHVSTMKNFKDDDEVRQKYYPELIAEAKRLTGAAHAMVASHVFRQVGETPGEVKKEGTRGGAFMIHGDFNDDLKDQFKGMRAQDKKNALDSFGLSQQEFEDGRLIVINCWRPTLREPLRRAPMAVCDATSVSASDFHIYAHDPNPPPQNYELPLPNMLTTMEYSPNHRWYTFPGMTRDECLVFKTYDSIAAQPGNGVGAHTAFEDPAGIDAFRQSIEARLVCFVRGS